MRRREVLKAGGLTACAVAWAGPGWSSGPAGGLVVDTRFPALANADGAICAWRHAVDGDVTRLWVDRLDAEWRGPGPSVTGWTGEDALFVLEHLAWSRERRVIVRQLVVGCDGPVPLVSWRIAMRLSRA